MMWKYSLIILLCISSISCASLKIHYNDDGTVAEVESHGIQDTEIVNKNGTTVKRKCAVDLWPTNLFTIMK